MTGSNSRDLSPLDRDTLRTFYVFDHESWSAIDMSVSVDGDRVCVLCQGVAREPNYYDGSVPQTRLSVDASFPLPSMRVGCDPA